MCDSTNGSGEVLLYGELSKWVPMSAKRFPAVVQTDGQMQVMVVGGISEKVTFWLSVDNNLKFADCVLSDTGQAVVSISLTSQTCT